MHMRLFGKVQLITHAERILPAPFVERKLTHEDIKDAPRHQSKAAFSDFKTFTFPQLLSHSKSPKLKGYPLT